jgi:hypothetical protein
LNRCYAIDDHVEPFFKLEDWSKQSIFDARPTFQKDQSNQSLPINKIGGHLFSPTLHCGSTTRSGKPTASFIETFSIMRITLLISVYLHLTLIAGGVAGFTPIHRQSGSLAISSALGMRVAYQGEPGAYSEKSTRELLGDKVTAIGRPDFESCFRAVASMEVDYACLPIENSLGGSIHENYDLMLRYDLTICAEHEFRVQHCVLTKPGVKLEDIKYAISHPQALAQCDNYLRSLGIRPIQTYDTAGSAKMISEDDLPSL